MSRTLTRRASRFSPVGTKESRYKFWQSEKSWRCYDCWDCSAILSWWMSQIYTRRAVGARGATHAENWLRGCDSLHGVTVLQPQYLDNFFLDSSSNVSCFFEEKAFDEHSNLVQPKEQCINKIGHGTTLQLRPFRGTLLTRCFCVLHRVLKSK